MVYIYFGLLFPIHLHACVKHDNYHDSQRGCPHTLPCLDSFFFSNVIATHNKLYVQHSAHSNTTIFPINLTTLFRKPSIGFALDAHNPHNFCNILKLLIRLFNLVITFMIALEGLPIHTFSHCHQQIHNVFNLFLC